LTYRILVGSYVTAEELRAGKEQLDYFGVSAQNCLVAIVDEAERNAPATQASAKQPSAKKSKKAKDPAQTPKQLFASNLASDPSGTVVICSSEERTEIASKLAKDLGLNYVTFKIVFGEGWWPVL
jgi:hypothetical protein